MAGMLANEVESSAWFLVRSRRSQGLRKGISLWKREPRAQVFDSTNGRRVHSEKRGCNVLIEPASPASSVRVWTTKDTPNLPVPGDALVPSSQSSPWEFHCAWQALLLPSALWGLAPRATASPHCTFG